MIDMIQAFALLILAVSSLYAVKCFGRLEHRVRELELYHLEQMREGTNGST